VGLRRRPPDRDRLTGDGNTGSVRVILETDRLRLRQFTLDDQQLLFELDNDPDVMRYLNGGMPTERSEVIEALEWWLGYYERGDAYGFWAAIDKATEAFVGWFHFRPRRQDGPLEPELGYRLHRATWGSGLATEGSQALIDRGFERFGVERVHAETMVVHAASRRVMEKVGMRFVRTFVAEWPVRIEGDEHGDVEYAITRQEWIADRLNAAAPP
jgi:RimJ/RimL family protein N-acetyltransferase